MSTLFQNRSAPFLPILLIWVVSHICNLEGLGGSHSSSSRNPLNSYMILLFASTKVLPLRCKVLWVLTNILCVSCTHHHSITQIASATPPEPHVPPLFNTPVPSSNPVATTNLFAISIVWSILERHRESPIHMQPFQTGFFHLAMGI